MSAGRRPLKATWGALRGGLRRRQRQWEVTLPRRTANRSPTVEAGATRRAIGYLLLDPGDQPAAVRTEELRRWCAENSVMLSHVVHDTEGRGDQRPSLQWALARIAARDADTLIVTRLADLSSSVSALSPLLRWFAEVGRDLVAIDLKIDTTTAEGRLAVEAVAGAVTAREGARWRPSIVQRATGYRRPAAPPDGIGLPDQRHDST